MLTAERIQEYTARGYSPRKLIKSPKNEAKNWQVKVAMGLIDPKDYDHNLRMLPTAVWDLADQIKDLELTEKQISLSKAQVNVVKFRKKYEEYRMWLIVALMSLFYSISFGIMAYLGRI